MNPAEIIEKARQRGVAVTLNDVGTGLSLSADGDLPDEIVELAKAHKPAIVAHLQTERGRVNYWIADKLIDWPRSHCLHCRLPVIVGQTWTDVTNGEVTARFHKECHPKWLAQQEIAARRALWGSHDRS
jgi:hypothetical protein